MRSRLFLAATGLLLAMAAFVYLKPSGPERGPDSAAKTKLVPSTRESRQPKSTSTEQVSPPPDPRPSLPLEEEIEAAVVTYSPAALPTFEKLLASGEPEIREAARDGLVRLGETGGAALLRRATARLTDPEEIRKFLETADYLELPSALEGPLKK